MIRPLPGQPGAAARRPPRPPSATTLVLSIIALAAAAIVGLLAILFLKVSSDQYAAQPTYQSEIDKLWTQEGSPMPGDQTVDLVRRQMYDVYLETSTPKPDPFYLVDVTVTNADTGEAVGVKSRLMNSSFEKDGRRLTPHASFTAPGTGRYTVHVASRPNEDTTGVRAKVGPSIFLVNGTDAAVGREFAIFLTLVAIALTAAGISGIRRHRRRQRDFAKILERFYEAQSAMWTVPQDPHGSYG